MTTSTARAITLTIMGRVAPPRMMKGRFAPDRSLTLTLSQRERERRCFASFIVTIAFTAAGVVAAQEVSTLPPGSRDAPQENETKDWSQHHLFPDPRLREQIKQTSAFLSKHATGTDNAVFRLKDEGLIDRRAASKIRAALDRARSSMTRLTESLETHEQINGWTARMISYDLGMAADALGQQASLIKASSSAGPTDGDGEPASSSSDKDNPQYLATILTESSRLLKQTAVAIVHHVK